MINEHQLIAIFCEIDDFCNELDQNISQPLLTSPTKDNRGSVAYLLVKLWLFKYCFK